MEEFKNEGFWWFPDYPDNKFSGTLEFDMDRGVVLELHGDFKQYIDREIQTDIILGAYLNGKPITLYRCEEIGYYYSNKYNYLQKRILSIRQVFIGAHFANYKEILFKRIIMKYMDLDNWSELTSFAYWRDKLNRNKFIIEYQCSKYIKANISPEYTISVVTEPIITKQYPRKFEIKNQPFILIESSSEKSFEDFFIIIKHFQYFFSLSILEPVYPVVINGEMDKNNIYKEGADHHNIVEILPIELYYKMHHIKRRSEGIPKYRMLFNLKDVEYIFELILINWFNKIDKLNSCLNLYFSILYNPYLFIESEFINVITALEIYHRRFLSNKELPEDVFNQRISEIINSVENKYEKWLKRKLKFANEPNLERRLRDIIDRNNSIISIILGDRDEVARFINNAVATRNYFTHYDKRLENKSVKGDELIELTEKLKIIIEICFLIELGFEVKDIEELFSRNLKYHRKHLLKN